MFQFDKFLYWFFYYMEQEQTTYVIGAGASKPLGLPTGKELLKEICKLFSSDRVGYDEITRTMLMEFNRQFKQHNGYVDQFIKNCNFISRNMPSSLSIDNFIHANKDNPEIVFLSKTAIAYIIHKHESKNKLVDFLHKKI